ncbi:hypothetical protein [Candidatus Phytoplasma pruni]|uniref:Uncharacterized protein n=1 Tax=Candidatus Phytoplasma pruni TaxID=479893 RepID=A0A851HJT2_9MOLU|nr:hypothetical protein [Candidatus Phytoplasma pruni]NWN45796.1 hypothetical protein [Candidatus Phytoplasma pruni]
MENKQTNPKLKIVSVLIKAIFSLFASFSLFYPEKIKYNDWLLSNILLAISIILFAYYFAFTNFKKNKGFIKFLFFMESTVLSLISVGLSVKPLIKNEYLNKMLELTNIIAYIFIVHFLIQIYVYYTKKEQTKNNFAFFSYLMLFGLSSYLLGAQKDELQGYILKSLSLVLFIFYLFYLFIFIKDVRKQIKNNKQTKTNSQNNVKPSNEKTNNQ